MIIREIITFSDAYYESRCLVFYPQNLPKYEQETMKKYGKIVGYLPISMDLSPIYGLQTLSSLDWFS